MAGRQLQEWWVKSSNTLKVRGVRWASTETLKKLVKSSQKSLKNLFFYLQKLQKFMAGQQLQKRWVNTSKTRTLHGG